MDIAAPAFEPMMTGLTMAELVASTRGRDAQRDLVEGGEVLRLLCGAVGLWWLMPVTRSLGPSQLLSWLYARSVKHGLRVTGRSTPERCAPRET